jgi:type II secretory pathway component GspD/PulD (secretin)
MLEVLQEVNAVTTETAFDAPVISTRSVQTRLLVRNGQTAVLGGLSDRQRDSNQSGVPILSSIPLLGGLFGRASRRATETELFLFLTPTVLSTDADVDSATTPLRARVPGRTP